MLSRIKPSLTRLATLLLLLTLGACGWQLRGYEPGVAYSESSFNQLKITTTSRDNAFFRRFNAALKRNNIEINDDASSVLELFKEQIDRKPLAYNRIGTPSQYKLSLSIEYQFKNNDEVLIARTRINSRRNYDFDENLIIAKDREQEALIREMRDELSQRIIRMIRSKI